MCQYFSHVTCGGGPLQGISKEMPCRAPSLSLKSAQCSPSPFLLTSAGTARQDSSSCRATRVAKCSARYAHLVLSPCHQPQQEPFHCQRKKQARQANYTASGSIPPLAWLWCGSTACTALKPVLH